LLYTASIILVRKIWEGETCYGNIGTHKKLHRIKKLVKSLILAVAQANSRSILAEKGFQIDAVDVSNEMLAIAKSKVKNVPFKKMDMRKLEFVDETFDGVLAQQLSR
jgi:ubiquinone/menaquinone biosynthesis C-methylase UbiE